MYFGQSPNLLGAGSTVGVRGGMMHSDKSSEFSAFIAGTGVFRDRPIRLDMEKIGICGVPSLWVSRDELIN